MKCYTILEGREPLKGLSISDDHGGEPAVVIGHPKTGAIVPVSKEYVVNFYNRRDYILRMRALMYGLDQRDAAESSDKELKNEFDLAAKAAHYPGQLRRQMEMAWEDNNEIRERFSDTSHHLIHGLIWSKEDPQHMTVRQSELSDRNEQHPMRLIRERRDQQGRRTESNCCLVYIETDALVGGEMWFESTSWNEVIGNSDGVDRVFKPFPSVGVEVMARGYSEHGAPQALLRMKKRASFRICRNGNFTVANEGLRPKKTADDRYAYPVMVVVWPGSSLRCFPPKRFERDSERQAA